MQRYTVDVVIPTFRPDEKFDRLMKMLKKQQYPIGKILIVNTDKEYFTKREYEAWPHVEIRHIRREEFDHGGTRDGAASLLCGDLILFMTQDAVPRSMHLVGRIVSAFEDERVAAAYARQLPAENCNSVERYVRVFNYPKESRIKTKEDLPTLGIKTFFCSNVCAMYRRSVYEELGGFEKHTIFNEDMIFAGKLVQRGWAVAYVAEAAVIHSHNYTNRQQFQRNFDLAVSQADHPDIFGMASSQSEGIRMVKEAALYFAETGRPWLIFRLVMGSACKFAGYRLGLRYRRLPKRLILWCTMNKAYWEGTD